MTSCIREDDEAQKLLEAHAGAMVCINEDNCVHSANMAATPFLSDQGELDLVLPNNLRLIDLPLRLECLIPMRSPKETRVLMQRVGVLERPRKTLHFFSLRFQSSLNLIANEQKGDLLRKAAHDLRQPLYALQLLLENITGMPEFCAVPEEERRFMENRLASASEATYRITQQIIDISLSLETVKPKIAPFNARDFAGQLLDRYIVFAQTKGIQLYCDLPHVPIVSDALLLERILGNLIDNAIRNTAEGSVEVSGQIDGDTLQIIVSDSGCGIPAEHLAQIFNEFYRVPGSTGTKHNLGLGLSVVADLTASLGHRLTIKSEPGRGTRFKVCVPIQA